MLLFPHNDARARGPRAGDIFDPLKRDLLKARSERMSMGMSGELEQGATGRYTFDPKVRRGRAAQRAGPAPRSHTPLPTTLANTAAAWHRPARAQMWGPLKVHSTPYGHCVDKTGAYVVQPQSER